MPPLSNLATRDVETLVHPYINLASFRESGPLVIERGQGAEGPLEGGAPGIDAGLEDLEGLDAHGVHLQPGGDEGRYASGHGAGIEAGHVQAHEPDGGQVGQRLGRHGRLCP
jgi:hypothetical protein